MAIHDGGVTERTVAFHEKDLEKAVTWRVLLDLFTSISYFLCDSSLMIIMSMIVL